MYMHSHKYAQENEVSWGLSSKAPFLYKIYFNS